MLRKNILRLGLLGLLSMTIAGCATVSYTRTTEHQREYEKPPITLKEDKTILKNIVTENIFDTKQEGYQIKTFVEEKSENNVKYTAFKRADTVKQTWKLVGEYNSLQILQRAYETDDVEQVIGTRTFEESEEKLESIYPFAPASGTPVRFYSKNFKFNNNLEEIVVNSDEKGCAIANIKKCPSLWRISETELAATLSNGLKDQIIDDSIRQIVTGSLTIKSVSYPIAIETVKKGSIVHDIGNPYISEIKNFNKTFEVRGYQFDFGEAYNTIQNIIKRELGQKFLVSMSFRVRDKENHSPVDDVLITLRPKKTIPLVKILAEEEKIRKRYFVEGSEFFEATKVDSSSLILTLDGQYDIPSSGTELVSNIGSVYEFEVTHPEYKFLSVEISFEKDNCSKIFEIVPLGKKIRTQQTRDTEGDVKDGE